MTPREWYETLNLRIFLWVDGRRLLKLLGASAYRARPHLVLELDTAGLLLHYENDVTLSASVSGATFVRDEPRSLRTRNVPRHRGSPQRQGRRRARRGLRGARGGRPYPPREPVARRRGAGRGLAKGLTLRVVIGGG